MNLDKLDKYLYNKANWFLNYKVPDFQEVSLILCNMSYSYRNINNNQKDAEISYLYAKGYDFIIDIECFLYKPEKGGYINIYFYTYINNKKEFYYNKVFNLIEDDGKYYIKEE